MTFVEEPVVVLSAIKEVPKEYRYQLSDTKFFKLLASRYDVLWGLCIAMGFQAFLISTSMVYFSTKLVSKSNP